MGHNLMRDPAELARAALHLGQHAARDVEDLEQFVIPFERMDVEQHRAAGVGVIGCEDRTARQVEDQPCVDRAEHEAASLRELARAAHVVQDPRELRRREVGVRCEARLGADEVGVSLVDQSLGQRRGAPALPADGVVDGLPAVAIPHHGGLALVRNAHGCDAVGMDPALELDFHHDRDLRGKDLHRVLLDPAGAGIGAFERARGLRDDAAVLVDDNGTHRSGAAIERHDVCAPERVDDIDQVEVLQGERHRFPLSILLPGPSRPRGMHRRRARRAPGLQSVVPRSG